MEIIKAAASHAEAMLELFSEARVTIAALGIDQWQNGYPSRAVVEEDLALARAYAVMDDKELCGTFVLMEDGEPTYDEIFDGHWLTGDDSQDYIAMHRVAISVRMRGKGISSAIVDYAAARARALGRASVRIDTHQGNVVMRRMLEKHGFAYCGVIYLTSGESRVAYEKILM